MMISKSTVEPSVREVFAMMEAADTAEPPADKESSSRVTEMMNVARARADFVPGASASRAKNQAPLPLTPEQLDSIMAFMRSSFTSTSTSPPLSLFLFLCRTLHSDCSHDRQPSQSYEQSWPTVE